MSEVPETDHLDGPCSKMLADILIAGNRIKYNMATEIMAAMMELASLRKDQNLPGTISTPTHVWASHQVYDTSKPVGSRNRNGFSLRSLHDGWRFFASVSADRKLSLKEQMREMRIQAHHEVDMIKLVLEIPAHDTPKGSRLESQVFDGWVYDPKGHFWPKE